MITSDKKRDVKAGDGDFPIAEWKHAVRPRWPTQPSGGQRGILLRCLLNRTLKRMACACKGLRYFVPVGLASLYVSVFRCVLVERELRASHFPLPAVGLVAFSLYDYEHD